MGVSVVVKSALRECLFETSLESGMSVSRVDKELQVCVAPHVCCRLLSALLFVFQHFQPSCLMSINFSCRATRKERERYQNNLTLGVNGQGPKPGPMRQKPDFPQAVNRILDQESESMHPKAFANPPKTN